MSDLTWTEMPEVDPEQPDELVLDFSGEIHRVAPADTFVIGRGGDLDIDDNPYLHRRFLVFAHSENLWWIANEGSRLSATLTDGEGLVQSRLAPGARMPLVFPRVILTFSAGPTTYEINLITSGISVHVRSLMNSPSTVPAHDRPGPVSLRCRNRTGQAQPLGQ